LIFHRRVAGFSQSFAEKNKNLPLSPRRLCVSAVKNHNRLRVSEISRFMRSVLKAGEEKISIFEKKFDFSV
jgi:hypothetical protein